MTEGYKNTMVLLVWHDAHSVSTGWMPTTEIEQEPAVVHSVGWLLPDAKPNHIVIAQSYIEDSADHILAIPLKMVEQIKILS
jgi:hypothetical protein